MVLLAAVDPLAKAILLPSGDQLGSHSSWGSPGINSCGVPPWFATMYNFGLGPENAKKAIFWPSGDHLGPTGVSGG